MKKIIQIIPFLIFLSLEMFSLPIGYNFSNKYGYIYNPVYYQNKIIFDAGNKGLGVIENDSLKFIAKSFYISGKPIIKDSLLFLYSAQSSSIIIYNLNKYQIERTLDTSNSALLNDGIRAFTIDANNNIWFVYDLENSIGKYDGNSITNYKLPDNLQYHTMPASPIIADNSGSIWLRGFSFLIKFDGLNFTRIDSSNSPIHPCDFAQSMYYSKKRGEIWLSLKARGPFVGNGRIKGNKNRLYKIKNNVWTEIKTVYAHLDATPENPFMEISEDQNGNIVILNDSRFSSDTKIIFIDSNESISTLSIPTPIFYSEDESPKDNITGACLVKKDLLLLSGDQNIEIDLNTYQNKIEKFAITKNNPLWKIFLRSDDTLKQIIDIKQNNGKYYIICSYGIDILSGSEWSRIDSKTTNLPMDAFRIRNATMKGDTLYAVTVNGLLEINTNNIKEFKYFNHLNSDLKDCWHNNIEIDNNKNLWICSDSAELVKYDGLTFVHIKIPENIPAPNGTNLKALAIDSSNSIYYSTQNNIVKYDGSNWTVFDKSNSLLSELDYVRLLYYSKVRNELFVFVSSESNNLSNKILRYKNGIWSNFKYADTSREWQIYGDRFINVSEDKEGALYFALLCPAEPVASDSVVILSKDDKWSSVESLGCTFNNSFYFSYKGILIDDDNKLWLGGNQIGLAVRDLKTTNIVESKIEKGPFADIWIYNIYPNPLNKNSKLDFFCSPEALNDIKIKLFNVLGEEIADIKDDITYNPSNGRGSATLKTAAIPVGYYLLNLSIKDESRTKSVIIE